MDLSSVILVICITLFGLFGAFILSIDDDHPMAYKLLGLFFILWALDFLDGMLMLNGFYIDHPDYALWSESFVFLYGPLIYFYTKLKCAKTSSLGFANLRHLAPFMLSILLNYLFFHQLTEQEKIEILGGITESNISIESSVLIVLVFIHFVSYILMSKRVVNQTDLEIKNYYSHLDLTWLKKLLNTLLAILSLSFLFGLLRITEYDLYFSIGLPIITLVMGTFIIYLIWRALKQPKIEIAHKISGNEIKIIESPESSEIIQLIRNKLDEEKIYLNPELTLDMMAESIEQSRRKVSQAINTHMGMSFFDLINSHRIEEAKRIFKNSDDPKLTVLEVMYQVGFNSKSSFNTQFKKRTGLTPSQFMKS